AGGSITLDTTVSPKPLFQTANLTASALTSIANVALDTGNVKSTATQVKANVKLSSDTSFGQVKQTP
ncbi:MAG: hypothetical protein ABW061_14350, partial [Polyangiaceae bacterium]